MSLPAVITSAAAALAAAEAGEALDAARHAIDAALEAVPIAVARRLLNEGAIARANLVADAAEVAKFPGEKA